MEIAVIRFIILGVISGLSEGAGALPDGPLNATVGETAMFTATLEKTFLTVSWKFGDRNVTFSGRNITAPEVEDRITLFMSTGSLELRNVTLRDSGEYSVTVTPVGECQREITTRLEVYAERRSAVSVTSTDLPIEGNSFNLTCEAAGSNFSRAWMKDGSNLSLTDNITLYDNNRVLSFNPIKRTDSGNYSCKISNSTVSSDEATYNMVVNYGPENIQITGQSWIYFDDTLILICSADSEPSANYTWILNGAEIHNSSVFIKVKTDLSDSGNYTCEAVNNVTGKTSEWHQVTVTGKTSICLAVFIAGTTIACLFILGVAGGGGYYIYHKKVNNRAPPQTRNKVEEHVSEDTCNVYANI